MILRSWRARATASGAASYARHFRDAVLPALRRVEGFVSAELWSEPRGDHVELLVLTRWASIEAIRAFAGDRHEEAVVEPEAAALLIDYDTTVRHFDVVQEAGP